MEQPDPMHQENQYLDLLRKVLFGGQKHETRNGTTLSSFGESLEFDIEKEFPLLTTKRMFWKGIVHELLWFLKARTNSKELEAMKINIWKGNSSRVFLDSRKLYDYEEGTCGPIYGFQWRNFGGTYKGPDHDYINDGDGIDQLGNIIDQIKTNPSSRRLVMSGWNPLQEKEMVLPPCHTLYQFYVHENKLSCQMYQRSADLFLGLPFNIASTALLTHLVANLTNLVPSKLKIIIGDAHIYENHVDAVQEQLSRTCFPWCHLKIINKDQTQPEDFEFDDFELENYKCHKPIKATMNV